MTSNLVLKTRVTHSCNFTRQLSFSFDVRWGIPSENRLEMYDAVLLPNNWNINVAIDILHLIKKRRIYKRSSKFCEYEAGLVITAPSLITDYLEAS